MRVLISGLLAAALTMTASASSAATLYAVGATPNVPVTLGAPDGAFYQFADHQAITFDLGMLTSGPSLLQVFTLDDISPASAMLEVSADDSAYSLVAATMFDTNGTVQAGPVYPSADFLVTDPFRYVRITDNADGAARNLGFDLDAVGVSAVPLPAAVWLLGGAFAGIAGRRRRAHA